MFGCCGSESKKFKSEKGVVDQERLEKIVAPMKEAGWSESRIEAVARCTCECHTDGIICMC